MLSSTHFFTVDDAFKVVTAKHDDDVSDSVRCYRVVQPYMAPSPTPTGTPYASMSQTPHQSTNVLDAGISETCFTHTALSPSFSTAAAAP